MPSTVDTHLPPARAATHILRRLAVFTRLIRNPTKTDDFTTARSPALTRKKTFGGVVQVAALLCGADGEVLSTLACLVRPGLKAIEPGATKVHGITQGKAMVYGLEIPALQGVAGRSMIAPMRVATCLSEWSLRWLELR